MAQTSGIDLLIENARIVAREGELIERGWLAVADGRIAALGEGRYEGSCTPSRRFDAEGCWLLPGAIDLHVHFREPGPAERADIASESRAALLGGVTSWVDMPNTMPPTTGLDEWRYKMDRAAASSVTNYAFYLGATADNIDLLTSPAIDPSQVAGVKLFYGSSTGGMTLDDDAAIERLICGMPKDMPLAVHAELNSVIAANTDRLKAEAGGDVDDLPVAAHSAIRSAEACTEATRRIIALLKKAGTKARARVHLLHVTTADELPLIAQAKEESEEREEKLPLTAETCPHYLLFTEADYERLGTMIKCNPAVKTEADRCALTRACIDGLIDTLGSDHAPHLAAAKAGGALKAASGMPGVQWLLPIAATLFGPERAAALTAHNPARIYGIADRGQLAPGYKADMALLRETPTPATNAAVASKCGFTPYDGMTMQYAVAHTWVNGSDSAEPSAAEPLTFKRPAPSF